MSIFYLITSILCLFLTDSVFAEERQSIQIEPVVVTASKIEEPVSEVPASIDVITHQDIKIMQTLTLGEALQSMSGLTIQTFGGADPFSSVYIRGTDSNHSFIMIDGIKINSPYSQIPSMGAIHLSDVGKVEVLRGSYSALYGSEAIGGVVNVITGDRPGLTYSFSGGTHTTFDNSLLYTGKYHDTPYTLGYERFSTEGFKFSGPYWNNTLLGKISLPLGAASSLHLATYYWNWNKYDRTVCCEINGSGDFALIIDKNSQINEDNWLTSIQFSQYPSETWDYNIKVSAYTSNSHSVNPLDPASTDRPFPLEIDSEIHSSRFTFDMQHNLYYGNSNIITLGFQYTGEEINKEEFGNVDSFGTGPSLKQPDVDADRTSRALYLQNLFKIKEQLSLSAGVRFENGPGFNNELIPRVSALYVVQDGLWGLSDTRLNISYGQGVRAPSLEELYHPVGGNSDLRPEKSTSLEAGFKKPLLDGRVWLQATGFIIKLKDLIDWSSDPAVVTYVNAGKAKIKGVETNLHWNITEKLNSKIGYTRLSTTNTDTGEDLSFRPHYVWTFDVRYKPVTRFVLDITEESAGEAFNPLDFIVGLDGNTLSERVKSHQVVNLAAAYNVIEDDPLLGAVDITLKLNNIFDEEYDVIPGFHSYGFTFLAGVRAVH